MFRPLRIPLASIALIAGWCLIAPEVAVAQTDTDSPFSLGFQSSWPSYGISGRYEVNEKAMVQAVIGALGTVTNFSGRVLLDLQQEEKYDLYALGTVGMWRWGGGGALPSETSVGFGGGVGVDLDLQKLISPDDEDFPPLFWNIEIGVIIANFDNYNFRPFALGTGFHWAF